MIEIKMDKEMLESKTFENQVNELINDYKSSYRRESMNYGGVKKSPMQNLYENGNLTLSFIRSEFPKIVDKKSTLPASQRGMIKTIVFEAARRAVIIDQRERAVREAQQGAEEAATSAERGSDD